jgi:ATP-dependent helicase/nuclease subunit A
MPQTFTKAQLQAITTPGNILVVAGAGTGKTSTLVGRALRVLLEERRSLQEILMVTFTEAAAAEMRQRLREALLEALQARPADVHLAEQVALLDTAHISTLHSFCLHLVSDHFHELGIDPQVSVLDPSQTRPLTEETLDTLFQRHYAENAPKGSAVRDLVRRQGQRSDERIRGLVLKIHAYSQSLPDPVGWFDRELARFRQPEPVLWRQWLFDGFFAWRDLWLPVLKAERPENVNAHRCAQLLGTVGTKTTAPTSTPLPAHPAEGRRGTLAQIAEVLTQIRELGQDQNWPRGTKGIFRDPIKRIFEETEFLHCLQSRTGFSSVPQDQVGRSTPSATDEPPNTGTALDPLTQDWNWVRPQMITLLELAREFTADFSQAKRDLGGVDFADLEQHALRLLRHPVTDGRPALAQARRQQFRYVFVDEYQDINAAQDAILTALIGDRASSHRFMVGDVKQSIYRFRLANPYIFRAYEEQWRHDSSAGRRIALVDNFRSREALLNFINSFFGALMRPGIGGVAYDTQAALRFGDGERRRALSVAGEQEAAGRGRWLQEELDFSTEKIGFLRENEGLAGPTANKGFPRAELLLLAQAVDEEVTGAESDEQSDLIDLTVTEREVRMVASRLRELKNEGHRVWDKEGQHFRQASWRDMVVLLRSPAGKVEAYAKEFHRSGVPLQAARGGFFEALEVMDLLNLLKLLDNPLQDVPLLAVLRSPLVGLSLEELVEVRAANGERPFWIALRRFQVSGPKSNVQSSEPQPSSPTERHLFSVAQTSKSAVSQVSKPAGPSTKKDAPTAPDAQPTWKSAIPQTSAWRKVDSFLRQFESWRELVRLSSLSHCLETALAETNYEAFLLAGDRGAERIANVRRLLDLARQYDPYQRQGLFRFLRFVAAQEEAELQREPAPLPAEDAVQLMSIHQSKGLEFPVVVVADLGKSFNLAVLREDILLDEEYGLCPQVGPPNTEARYPSLPYWLARQRERQELLGEELRLFYVAATRARDTLILSGAAAKKAGDAKWEAAAPAPLSDQRVLGARSYLDWLRLWLPQSTTTEHWRSESEGESSLLRWRIYAPNDPVLAVRSAEERPLDLPAVGHLTEATCHLLEQRVTWQYPFLAATVQPAKTSVSALQQQATERDEEAWPIFKSKAQSPKFKVAPGATPGKLSAAQVGTAHHLFLQWMGLEGASDVAQLRVKAERLESEGILSTAEVAALDFRALSAFWGGELGRRIGQHAGCLHRELQFTAGVTASDLAALALPPTLTLPREEFLVVQGVVDLAVILPAEIWIVDFKTDQVTAEELPEKRAFYGPQLMLYGVALERIYRRPVTERWLHFLALERTVDCR